MKTLIILFAINLLSVGQVSAEAIAKDSSLAGHWSGYFVMTKKFIEHFGLLGLSSKNIEENKKVYFQLNLKQSGAMIDGVMTEPNLAEDSAKRPTHRALINGKVDGRMIKFTKTYEIMPAIVEYDGTISSDLKNVSGKYTTEGLTGTFVLDKLEH